MFPTHVQNYMINKDFIVVITAIFSISLYLKLSILFSVQKRKLISLFLCNSPAIYFKNKITVDPQMYLNQ